MRPTASNASSITSPSCRRRRASDEWRARAAAELDSIADAEDRQILEQDLATLP
jgi:hypothetical protein